MDGELLILGFLKLLEMAEVDTGLAKLETEVRHLLYYIAHLHTEGRKICIGDVLACGHLCAPLTASKRLRHLESDGWVAIKQDPTNHRRRFVSLTPKSVKSLKSASAKLEKKIPKIK
ncbi:MAG: hypothetical protein ACKOW3_09520 [Hyphomicrobium sp.]